MRNYNILLFMISMLISGSIFSQELPDTVYLTLGPKKEKFIEHIVYPGETLYSIAPFYGLMPQNVLQANKQLDMNSLKVGQRLKIPIPNIAITRFKKGGFVDSLKVPVIYKVKHGETLYTISKKYFRMPIDTIMQRNNMYDYRLSVGMPLHIGWMDKRGVPDSIQMKIKRIFTKKMLTEEDYKRKNKEILDFDQQGIAYWQKGAKSGGHSMTLHRTAKVGSMITIINPMTKKKIRTKVVGRIPPVFDRDVILVLSPSTARRLGAVDSRFYVKIKY